MSYNLKGVVIPEKENGWGPCREDVGYIPDVPISFVLHQSYNFLQFAMGSMAHIVRCTTYDHFPANCSLAGEYFMPQEMVGLYLHLGLSWTKKVLQP